ncbi:hypothetical protein GCM10027594_18420 [Hymenobacter agri]
MKTTALLLLTCLLLALRTVAQAPEKTAPEDLVVTAEILSHRYQAPKNGIGKPQLVLYAKLVVRNKTNHDRKILTMSCSWTACWTYTGGFLPSANEICEKNTFTEIVIPVGRTLVFYCPLFDCRKTKYVRSSDNGTVSDFKVGLVDFTDLEDFMGSMRGAVKNRTVYWSNQLNADVSVKRTPKVAAHKQPAYYTVVASGK